METKQKQAYGVLITPFHYDGSVDFVELEKNLEMVCTTDIDGIVACGSTGEIVQLSPESNMEIMSRCKDVIQNRKKLICGGTAPDYQTAVRYLSHMQKLGADGALIAPPYYFPINDEEVLAYYSMLSQFASGMPIIAYQIPQFTSKISLSIFEKLLEIPGICGLKNSGGSITEIMHEIVLRNQIRPDFKVYTGTDEAIFSCLSSGCDGSMTALGYLLPELIALLYRLMPVKDRALAIELDVVGLTQLANSLIFPIGYKMIGQARGFSFGGYKQIPGLTESKHSMEVYGQIRKKVGEVYDRYGLKLRNP